MGPFAQILPKNEFFLKKELCQFYNIRIIYLSFWQKSEKPNEPFLRKLLDGHTKNQSTSLIFFVRYSQF